MHEPNRAQPSAQDRAGLYPAHFAEMALRGFGQLYDMQVAATRVLLQTQARAAAAFGWPVASELYGNGDERARRLFSTGADQLLQGAQRASEAAAELQRQVGRVIEKQAATAADNWQRGLEELGAQANEGLTQLVETARQQAEAAERATAALGEAASETMRRGSEQLRDSTHEGFERVRESMSQGAEDARQGDW